MSSSARLRLGVIGAGRMGRPVMGRLVEAGYEVRVLGRSAQAQQALAGAGAKVVTTIADVAAGADAVLVCAFSDEQVREICLGSELLSQLPDGATVVVHTTGSPRTIAAIADRAAALGSHAIDAPFSGGPHDIAAGRVTLFVGGADDTVARIRPVLSCYADPVLHVGPVGHGQRVKLINNTLFAAQLGLLLDATRLGALLGVDEAVLIDALPHGSAASRALTIATARGSATNFVATAREFLVKDLNAVRTVAAELGGDLGALDVALGILTAPGTLSDVG